MLKKIFGKDWLLDTVYEIVGSILIAAALYNFALNAGFPTPGFSGIAMIIYRLTGFPIGVTSLLLNIPLALVCFRLIGRNFFFRSLRAMIISSFFIDYVAPLFIQYEGSRLIAAICTGVLGGLGYAMIYLRNSSTGGSDFIVMAVKSRNQHIPLGTLVFATDALIITAGGIIFRDFDGIVYGMIINMIYAYVADKILYGLNSGKLAIIITHHSQEIVAKIDEVSERGATVVPGIGGYSSQPISLVFCACSNKDLHAIEEGVKETDPQAFTVMLDSNAVMGEGFKLIRVAEPEKHDRD